MNSNGPILFNQALIQRYGKSEIGQKIRGELRIGYNKIPVGFAARNKATELFSAWGIKRMHGSASDRAVYSGDSTVYCIQILGDKGSSLACTAGINGKG